MRAFMHVRTCGCCILSALCVVLINAACACACFSPPKKPLGEILASDQDANKLAASERATEDLLSRLAECERRLGQCRDFTALLASRSADAAAAKFSDQERDRYACCSRLPLPSPSVTELVILLTSHGTELVLLAVRYFIRKFPFLR